MANRRNYYRILHVQPDAPSAVIQSSYRALMTKLKMHPDLGGDHESAALINEAYGVLMDPLKRQSYDQALLEEFSESEIRGDRHHRRKTEKKTPEKPAAAPNQHYQPMIHDYCAFCKTPHYLNSVTMQSSNCSDCQSPLANPLRLEVDNECRRAIHRIASNINIRYYSHWPQHTADHALLQNISTNGLQLVTNKPIYVGEIIKIESGVFSAVACIANCKKHANGKGSTFIIGAEFVALRFFKTRGAFISEST